MDSLACVFRALRARALVLAFPLAASPRGVCLSFVSPALLPFSVLSQTFVPFSAGTPRGLAARTLSWPSSGVRRAAGLTRSSPAPPNLKNENLVRRPQVSAQYRALQANRGRHMSYILLRLALVGISGAAPTTAHIVFSHRRAVFHSMLAG